MTALLLWALTSMSQTYRLEPEWVRFKPCGLEHTLEWHDWIIPGEGLEDARGWIQLDKQGKHVPVEDVWVMNWRPHLCPCQKTWSAR